MPVSLSQVGLEALHSLQHMLQKHMTLCRNIAAAAPAAAAAQQHLLLLLRSNLTMMSRLLDGTYANFKLCGLSFVGTWRCSIPCSTQRRGGGPDQAMP